MVSKIHSSGKAQEAMHKGGWQRSTATQITCLLALHWDVADLLSSQPLVNHPLICLLAMSSISTRPTFVHHVCVQDGNLAGEQGVGNKLWGGGGGLSYVNKKKKVATNSLHTPIFRPLRNLQFS